MQQSEIIYIDHNTTALKGEMLDFVNSLKSRISRIESEFKIITYEDIHDESLMPDQFESMLAIAADVISKSFITIAIIDESYLNTSLLSEKLISEIEKINLTKNRFFFPIIFGKTNWLSAKWLVKLKLYPNNSSVVQLNDIEKTKLIETIASKIESITSLPKNKNINSTFESLVESEAPSNRNSVFISHAHEDSDFAELLQLKLKENAIDSWVDSERLKIGQDWKEGIDKGIDESIAMIVLMSPDAKKSEYVTYEWAYAWGKGKPIFPIMLEQTSLHPRLESIQYLNFTMKSSRPYQALFDSINNLKT